MLALTPSLFLLLLFLPLGVVGASVELSLAPGNSDEDVVVTHAKRSPHHIPAPQHRQPDNLPPVFVLNLDRAPDRWECVLREVNREGLGVVRLPAVDGKKLSPEELKNKTTALARFFQPKGVLGCYLSHHHFWQVVVDSKLPMAVILEDDVQLTSGFEEKLRRLVREMDDVLGQDWDVVLLGAIGRVHPEGRDTYSSRFFSTYIGGNRRLKRVSPRLYIPIRPAGTHAYMISQEGARKLLSLCAKATFHVDLDAWRHPSLRLYMSDPMLVHQTFQDTSLTELPASIVPSLPVPLPLPNLPSALSLRKLDDWTRDPITKQPWSHVLAEPLLQVTPYGPVITVQRYLIIVTALTVSSSLFSHLGWVWMGRALMGSMVGFVVAIRGIIWLLMNWR